MVHLNTKRLFETLVSCAFVDGILSDDEKAFLHRKATELNIPILMMEEVLDKGARKELRFVIAPTMDQRLQQLDDLINIVCADGMLERMENRLLLRFARHVNIGADALGKRVQVRLREMSRQPRQMQPRRIPKSEDLFVISDDTSPKAETLPKTKPESDPQTPEPRKEKITPSPKIHIRNPSSETPHRQQERKFDLAEAAQMENASGLLDIPPGPIKLFDAMEKKQMDLPPITKNLLRSTIMLDGVTAGVQYMIRNCGYQDEAEAKEYIEKMVAADPGLVPRSIQIQ